MVTKYQNIALHQLILFVILLLLSKNIYMMPRLDILYIKQSVILYLSLLRLTSTLRNVQSL